MLILLAIVLYWESWPNISNDSLPIGVDLCLSSLLSFGGASADRSDSTNPSHRGWARTNAAMNPNGGLQRDKVIFV